ncbi:UDP-GlcNAc3NAcA epimerase [Pricia antarctica]|uniref:UDP-GlcNAc3NAcA epimerase n=1 Tax=Pricia antarctica TaxID=641691 RepID=A0A1G6YPL6_9FLAO|nr:UDP-N-acetylglucosamine 2-epimerase (non-hydrolyzing) [Pricia antarctica]SDD92250.1 UDP-GlcNAc3NAcA epimerase [Pricia antarctica]
MKILTIIGARPQFIKAAAVSRVIQSQQHLDEILVHTGQHFDANMSAVFFDELNIPEPKYNLDISGGSHGEQTGKMLIKIEEVLLKENPDLVLVYGDTNSTLAAALAAVKLHIPLAHVEAGLRSFNKKMPEEINRILTDHSSDILFTPTAAAIKNLQNEGIDNSKILNVGDVMLDATNYYGTKAEEHSSILTDLKLTPKGYILVTVHRAENTDSLTRLKSIFDSLEKLSSDHNLVIPVHPRTMKSLKAIDFSRERSKIKFISPVGYLDMMMLEKYSKTIITDSGGVQKEAYFHKVPCVTLRDETEWTELVVNGWNFLANSDNLFESFSKAQKIKFSDVDNIYGDGDAAFKIVDKLLQYPTSI